MKLLKNYLVIIVNTIFVSSYAVSLLSHFTLLFALDSLFKVAFSHITIRETYNGSSRFTHLSQILTNSTWFLLHKEQLPIFIGSLTFSPQAFFLSCKLRARYFRFLAAFKSRSIKREHFSQRKTLSSKGNCSLIVPQ